MSNMKRMSAPSIMFGAMVLCIALTVLLWRYNALLRDIFFAMSLQLVLTHLAAPVIFLTFKMKFNYKNAWFRERSFENKLYETIKIRKLKSKMPIYAPSMYKISRDSAEKTIMYTCHAEVVHELSALLGALCILMFLLGINVAVLTIVSIVAVAVHLFFAMIQRYNRPRLIRILRR